MPSLADYNKGVERGRRLSTALPTMTLIQQVDSNFFSLTTEKGRTVEVGLNQSGCSIYIKRNGLKSLSMGRHFFGSDALVQAVEAYKAADVKAALRALISDLAC